MRRRRSRPGPEGCTSAHVRLPNVQYLLQVRFHAALLSTENCSGAHGHFLEAAHLHMLCGRGSKGMPQM